MSLNQRSFFQNALGRPSSYLSSGEHVGSYDGTANEGSRAFRNRLTLPHVPITLTPLAAKPSRRPSDVIFIAGMKAFIRRFIRKSSDTSSLDQLNDLLQKDLDDLVGDFCEEEWEDGNEPTHENCLEYLLKLR